MGGTSWEGVRKSEQYEYRVSYCKTSQWLWNRIFPQFFQ